jgi:periplasmic divalent cation tolerance protein
MQDCKKADILTVTTTVGSMDAARELARSIVEARLAACVQIDAIAASLYRWEGAICEEPEFRLTIKTTPQMQAPLEAYIARHHPYELPQFTSWPTSCTAEYAQWVDESMRPSI